MTKGTPIITQRARREDIHLHYISQGVCKEALLPTGAQVCAGLININHSLIIDF